MIIDWRFGNQVAGLLRSFSDFEDNWDGYGAPKIKEEVIERAIKLLNYYEHWRDYIWTKPKDINRKYRPQYQYCYPFIAPGSDGSILFDYCDKSQWYNHQLELTVPSDCALPLEYLKILPTGKTLEGITSDSNLDVLFFWLFNGNLEFRDMKHGKIK